MSATIKPKSPYLDMEDFNHTYKYKLIVPLTYILCWIGMFFGPLYFGNVYYYLSTIVYTFGTAKYTSMFVAACISVIQNRILISKIPKENTQKKNFIPLASVTQQIYHTFIIPSYKESVQLIGQTLSVLASHDRAKSNYIIALAMEKHEKDSDKKALEIIAKYSQKFRLMHFTVHQMRQFEQKGKSSNVSWCGENLEPFFQKNMIDPDNVFLTIIDADSWAPNIYFDQVELYLRNHYQRKDRTCFSCPQIYTRNHMQGSVFTRVGDFSFSQMHSSNLFSFSKISFALSNYSLSYNLMKSVNFWDTVQDAIGQDFHTFQKVCWKTDGDIDYIPIFAPFNQISISTEGSWQNFKSRFWQAERHGRGLADLAYSTHQLLTQKFTPRKFFLYLCVCDFCLIPIMVPWFIFSTAIQINIYEPFGFAYTPSLSDSYYQIVTQTLSIMSFGLLILYEIMKRQTNTHIYKIKNDNIIRTFIQVNLFSVFALLFLWTPACVIANFGNLKTGRQYVVAQKKTGQQNKSLLQGQE